MLVVASERFSGWLDMTDRSTCIILGDGAGAAVVGASRRGRASGRSSGAATARSSTRSRSTRETRFFRQEGQAVYRWATSQMAPVALEACRRAGVDPAELAAFVPHQANLRIIDAIARRLGAAERGRRPRHRHLGQHVGGDASRSRCRAWSSAARSRPARPVLLLGFGSGLAYAGQVVLAP